MDKVLVIIPTYNERESLPMQVAAVRAATPQADILVVDDGSPDGTAAWVRQYAATDPQVHLLPGTDKSGLGKAYLRGFNWGLARDYQILVEMDADGSHQAFQLNDILRALDREVAAENRPGLVIGSRWVPGGSVVNWPRHRKWLSQAANTYVRLMLGMEVRDATAGFRAFTAATLRQIDFAEVESQGYCFQIDMTWRVQQLGISIEEVPIEFVERAHGTSKMSGAIIREALLKVTAWGFTRRWRGLMRSRRS